MLSEDTIFLYARSRAWTACVEFLHAGEYIRWVILERGTKRHQWGPLGAVQRLSVEEFFAYLEGLEDCQLPEKNHTIRDKESSGVV
jgi:hypothetical protein